MNANEKKILDLDEYVLRGLLVVKAILRRFGVM